MVGVYGTPIGWPRWVRIRPRQSGRGSTSLDCQSPVPPRWLDQSIYRWWVLHSGFGPGSPAAGRQASPVVGPVDIPVVGQVETVHLSSPPMSGELSPGSLQTIAFEDVGSRRFHCPLIASKRGVCRRCRQMEVSLVCCQTHRES